MKKCNIDGCDRDIGKKGAKGMCPLHYGRYLRTGSAKPEMPVQEKYNVGKKCCVSGCDKPARSKRMCQRHYLRAKKHGDPNKLSEKYHQKIRWCEDKKNFAGDECLSWPFGVSDHGRGQVKNMSAPRYMCILAHGQPPSSRHHAAHECGQGHKGCMNPKHLVWKTAKENEADKLFHGTLRRGEAINTSKVSEEQVREIRDLIGKISGVEIAKAFGITPAAVSSIKKRKSWAWLE